VTIKCAVTDIIYGIDQLKDALRFIEHLDNDADNVYWFKDISIKRGFVEVCFYKENHVSKEHVAVFGEKGLVNIFSSYRSYSDLGTVDMESIQEALDLL